MATAGDLERFDEGGQHPLGDQDCFCVVAQAVEEHRELVTAEAGKEILTAHHGSDTRGYFDEQLVARAVPERVVDELEVIDVEVQDADERLCRDAPLPSPARVAPRKRCGSQGRSSCPASPVRVDGRSFPRCARVACSSLTTSVWTSLCIVAIRTK